MMLTDLLVRLYLTADRRGTAFIVPAASLKEAIERAANMEEYAGPFPWETGAEGISRYKQPK